MWPKLFRTTEHFPSRSSWTTNVIPSTFDCGYDSKTAFFNICSFCDLDLCFWNLKFSEILHIALVSKSSCNLQSVGCKGPNVQFHCDCTLRPQIPESDRFIFNSLFILETLVITKHITLANDGPMVHLTWKFEISEMFDTVLIFLTVTLHAMSVLIYL